MNNAMAITQMFPKMRTLYSLEVCEKLMEEYYERGGECVTLVEGSLGLGVVICYADGLKTTVIKEVCINEWSSGHTIRMYNKMPKKYEQMLENFWNNELNASEFGIS